MMDQEQAVSSVERKMEQMLHTLQQIELNLQMLVNEQRIGQQLAFTQIEAAKLIGIDRKSLHEETKLGRIRRTYRKLYSREEIEKYLRDGCEKENEFVTRRSRTSRLIH